MARELNRSNSDLLTVKMISDNVTLSPIERMELIARVVDGYRSAVGNTPAAHGARKLLSTRNHLGQR